MTTVSPTQSGGQDSVDWKSIRLNVIMIPVSIAVVIALIAFVCLCRYVRSKRHEELEKQRQRELRMSRRQYVKKINEGLQSNALTAKTTNGQPFSPRPNRQHSDARTKYSNSNANSQDIYTIRTPRRVRKETKVNEQLHDENFNKPPLQRQGTFNLEEDTSPLSEEKTSPPPYTNNIDVEANSRDASVMESDLKTHNSLGVSNSSSSRVEYPPSGDRENSGATAPTSPVRVTLRNGTVGPREKLPYPTLGSPPSSSDQTIPENPPPSYYTTKLLNHDRKIIPPITQLPAVK